MKSSKYYRDAPIPPYAFFQQEVLRTSRKRLHLSAAAFALPRGFRLPTLPREIRAVMCGLEHSRGYRRGVCSVDIIVGSRMRTREQFVEPFGVVFCFQKIRLASNRGNQAVVGFSSF